MEDETLLGFLSASGRRVSESALVVVESAGIRSKVAFLFGAQLIVVLIILEPATLIRFSRL